MALQCQRGRTNDPPRTASPGIKLSLSAPERTSPQIIESTDVWADEFKCGTLHKLMTR